MEEKVSISVIVAIYQAELYLNRCVDSIINQSFSDIEILLIDDGSTDRSGDICDEYAKKDSRVKVFHKRNEGLSATRQFGMEQCCGEYTIHCDPDDWMEANMLELLHEKAVSSDSDIVMCDVLLEYKTHSVRSVQKVSDMSSENLLSVVYDPLSASVCNKLIKADCYRKYDVKFAPEVAYAEDLYVLLQLFSHPLKVEYVGKALYHYDKFSNGKSITNMVSIEKVVEAINLIESNIGGNAELSLKKLKRDALIIAYKAGREVYKDYYRLYHEIDSELLIEGLMHPIKNRMRLVVALDRYGLAWIARIYMSIIRILKNIITK